MTESNSTSLLSDVATYYEKKLALHGNSPKGVDWNGEESQSLRFEQLCKLIGLGPFSINDLGCGYGAMYDYLTDKYEAFSYFGFDVSPGMIQAAQDRQAHQKNAFFAIANKPNQVADFSVASGIFNVSLNRSVDEWTTYIESTIDDLDAYSRSGFAFNCLTSYSDPSKMRDDLYYADPKQLFDLCKRRYSRNVSLLHDYDLYEFTILVRKMI